MATLELISYKKEHALSILDQNRVDRNFWAPIQVFGKNTWTFLADEKVVACGGIELSDWRKGTAWFLFSSLFYKFVKTIYKTTKELITETVKRENLVRIDFFVDASNSFAIRYAERLGFECEGLLHSYGPKREDMFIYARIY